MSSPSLLARATLNVRGIVRESMRYADNDACVLVYDSRSELAQILVAAYRTVCDAAPRRTDSEAGSGHSSGTLESGLPRFRALDFDAMAPGQLKPILQALPPGSLVILVQSDSFQLPDYRIRVELTAKEVKVVSHSNLSKSTGNQAAIYIDALAYDAAYYHPTAHGLKRFIDSATNAVIESRASAREGADVHCLRIRSAFESAKLNIGEFDQPKAFSSQFPVGEVFTEARDLEAVSGTAVIYAFANLRFRVQAPKQPILLHIENGRVVSTSQSTPEFDQVLATITQDEGCVRIREIGFGLNRALSKTCVLEDVGAFERVVGVHLSLGAKHGVYKKPGMSRSSGRYHVDVFVDTARVLLGDTVIFENDTYSIEPFSG
jgi:aminopeptidase